MASIAASTGRADAPARYPVQLIASARLADGTAIVIRPIRPQDDAIERSFIGGLSSDSRYNRLLGARKLTAEEIRHLTRIDYDREMAFIAVTADAAQEILLGVARYVKDADGSGAEFAIVVADAWQRQGIGSLLLGALLRRAQSAGIARLHGITLAGNQAMQKLARRLEFVQKPDPQDATVRQLEKTLPAAVAPAMGRTSPLHQPAAAANVASIGPGVESPVKFECGRQRLASA